MKEIVINTTFEQYQVNHSYFLKTYYKPSITLALALFTIGSLQLALWFLDSSNPSFWNLLTTIGIVMLVISLQTICRVLILKRRGKLTNSNLRQLHQKYGNVVTQKISENGVSVYSSMMSYSYYWTLISDYAFKEGKLYFFHHGFSASGIVVDTISITPSELNDLHSFLSHRFPHHR